MVHMGLNVDLYRTIQVYRWKKLIFLILKFHRKLSFQFLVVCVHGKPSVGLPFGVSDQLYGKFPADNHAIKLDTYFNCLSLNCNKSDDPFTFYVSS